MRDFRQLLEILVSAVQADVEAGADLSDKTCDAINAAVDALRGQVEQAETPGMSLDAVLNAVEIGPDGKISMDMNNVRRFDLADFLRVK